MPKDVLLPKFFTEILKKKARYRKVRYCVPKTVPKCTDFDRLSVQKIRAKKSLKSANFYRISYRIFYWQIYWQIGRNHAEEHQIRLFGTALISISRYYYLPNVKISSVQFGKNFGTRTSLSMPIFYFNNCNNFYWTIQVRKCHRKINSVTNIIENIPTGVFILVLISNIFWNFFSENLKFFGLVCNTPCVAWIPSPKPTVLEFNSQYLQICRTFNSLWLSE